MVGTEIMEPRHLLKIQFYEALCLSKTHKFMEAIQALNTLLSQLPSVVTLYS